MFHSYVQNVSFFFLYLAKLKASKDKGAQKRIDKFFELDSQERNFGRYIMKSASSGKGSDDSMEDNTAQSIPKKSSLSDDLSDDGMFDMSETPQARRPSVTNTQSKKKIKTEASSKTEAKTAKGKTDSVSKSDPKVIDLTGKKSTVLQIQGRMDLEEVQAQFKEVFAPKVI